MTHTDFSCDIFTTDLAQNSFRRIAAPLHGQPMSGKLSVADSGEGPAPPHPTPPLPTPLFLDQPDARKAETIFFDR